MSRLSRIIIRLCLMLSIGFLYVALITSSPVTLCAAGMCAAPAIWRIVAAMRRHSDELHRIDYGLCRGCGYDLRGSRGRCPECGREFKPHERAKLRMDG